jgi:hypothetical protein
MAKDDTAQNLHRMLLEALRHREEQILRFIAILAPALGGFVWLLNLDDVQSTNLYVFGIGTIGVLFLLAVGSVYSLALGYNYRYITLQVRKPENELNICKFILKGWHGKECYTDDFQKKYGQYCEPPEIIKVFWWAFNIGIIGVALAAVVRIYAGMWESVARLLWASIIIVVGIVCVAVGWLMPMHYGSKLKELCESEKKST